MEHQSIVQALLLGLLEGLTEFIPVSSTGHILLAGHFLGFESTGKAFEVLIQLGAILAILSVYFGRLWKILVSLPSDARARRFVLGVLAAFLPAAVIGALAHDFIKTVLFETPMLICIMLVLGGLVLLWIDRLDLKPRYHDAMDFPLSLCVGIGLFQCLAMIPGTSRSGSTIVGGLLFGADRKAAAEFSFWLAMPTMVGAFVYEAYKSRNDLTADNLTLVGVGFVCSFIAGLFVVKSFLRFVQRYSFAVFAWWRILVGTVGMFALYFW